MTDPILQPSVDNVPHQDDAVKTPKRIPQLNFWLAMVAQLVLLATIAGRSIYAIATGTTVYLKTAPVDPYDLLRGYYQTLNYQISSSSELKQLPGGNFLEDKSFKSGNREIFVTLALPKNGRGAAQPIFVSNTKPHNLPSDQIAIRGVFNGWQVHYDIEKFYMPEAQAQNVNTEIRGSRNLLVEVKVDSGGHPTLMGLWIDNKKYDF
jgi:uncharacterized membrane-anchored protein